MNLSLILQLFVRDRWGRVRSAAQEWSRALKQDLSLSRKRRPRGAGSWSLQAESLEVRQVLSGVAPTVFVDESPFAGEASSNVVPPAADVFYTSDEQWLVESLRTEFLAALEASKSQQPSFPAKAFSGLAESESASSRVGRPGMGALADSSDPSSEKLLFSDELLLSEEPPFSDESFLAESAQVDEPQSGQVLRVEVEFDWTEGPRRISLVERSGSSWHVTLGGLGSTSLKDADAGVTEQLFVFNAAEIIRSVQSYRTVEFTFAKSETPKQSVIEFGSASLSDPSAGIHQVDQRKHTRPILQGIVSGNGNVVAPASVPIPGDLYDHLLWVDDVFRADSFFLDDTSLSSGMIAAFSVGGPALSGDPPSGGLSHAAPVAYHISSADREETPSVVFETIPLPASGKSSRLVRRGWSGMWGSRISDSDLAGERAVLSRHFSLAEFSVSPAGAIEQPQSSASVAGAVNWLAHLMDPSGLTTETARLVRTLDYFELNIRPTAVPVFQQNNGVARERQVSGCDIRSQARRQRESQRQILTYDAPQCLWTEQFESPLLPASGSIPRELRYVARPRGPPVYGRDADTPFGERDAPASLLERLRYSIAPRGPSLVAAEMHSPDVQSFSGPRVSPERFACQLAC